jgi:hypothetical protein
MKINGCEYEIMREIPSNFGKELFRDTHNKPLAQNNKEFEEVYLLRADDSNIDLVFDDDKVCKLIIDVKQNAKVNVKLLFKAKIGKPSLDFVTILNENSEVVINVFAEAENIAKASVMCRTFCLSERAKANVNLKAVARDYGKIFCEAMGKIAEKAKFSEIYIKEEGLVIGNGKVEFFPNLEIDNNEVKAGHSAKIKRLTKDEMFYFNSKGMSQDNANELFIESFMEGFG